MIIAFVSYIIHKYVFSAMKYQLFFVIIFASIQRYQLNPSKKLEFLQVYQWSQLEFDYANDKERQKDIREGIFKPGIPAPIDVDVFYDHSPKRHNRVFITIPRFQDGIPVTLGLVLDKKLNNNNIIKPYPSWDWHRDPTECKKNRLISVFRIQVRHTIFIVAHLSLNFKLSNFIQQTSFKFDF